MDKTTTPGVDLARVALAAVFLVGAWVATDATLPGLGAPAQPAVIPADLAEPSLATSGR